MVDPDSGFKRYKKMTFGLGDGKKVFEKGTKVQLKFKSDIYGEINYFQTQVRNISRYYCGQRQTLVTVCTRHHTINCGIFDVTESKQFRFDFGRRMLEISQLTDAKRFIVCMPV